MYSLSQGLVPFFLFRISCLVLAHMQRSTRSLMACRESVEVAEANVRAAQRTVESLQKALRSAMDDQAAKKIALASAEAELGIAIAQPSMATRPLLMAKPKSVAMAEWKSAIKISLPVRTCQNAVAAAKVKAESAQHTVEILDTALRLATKSQAAREDAFTIAEAKLTDALSRPKQRLPKPMPWRLDAKLKNNVPTRSMPGGQPDVKGQKRRNEPKAKSTMRMPQRKGKYVSRMHWRE